jgi:peptidyl-tRNA hydrolase, PTH1 family
MKLVVGIGNPGREYEATRHNVGFMVLDRLAEAHGIGSWRQRFHAQATDGLINGERCLLLKPGTYVNESGRAVRAAVDWCRISVDDVIVVCDDMHLPVGRLRVRGKGSSGGHNGLASIAAHLDGEGWTRLRIGIGRVEAGRAKSHVLSRFGKGDASVMDEAMERSVSALELWLAFGLDRCQNEFNSDPQAQRDNEEKS